MNGSTDVRVDGARLWERIEALGEIGAVHGPNGERGCNRLALTGTDGAGRDLVMSWMADLGLDVTIDAIGNVVATRAGTVPGLAPVMTGSHIDTVRSGGRFDGILGVLAGLEVLETLSRHGIDTPRPIAVGFFTDEEGARFAPDMLGSLVYVGGMAVEEALDVRAVDDGARLGDELARIGYAGPTPCPSAVVPHAFVELHIEQGPVLEREGVTIGAVTGVQGISWTQLTIVGQSAHAGTTPMGLRHDAGYAAAAITVGVRAIARRIAAPQVATVGRLELTPDLVNVVPGRAVLTVDLRHSDEQVLRQAEAELEQECRRRRRAGGRGHRPPVTRPLRAGGLRRVDDRAGRVDRRAPRSVVPEDAVRRRPRRPDAVADLPDVDDLRAERRRPVAQHRRAHRSRTRPSRRRRPPPRHPRKGQRNRAGDALRAGPPGPALSHRSLLRFPIDVVRSPPPGGVQRRGAVGGRSPPTDYLMLMDVSRNSLVTMSAGVRPAFGALSSAV